MAKPIAAFIDHYFACVRLVANLMKEYAISNSDGIANGQSDSSRRCEFHVFTFPLPPKYKNRKKLIVRKRFSMPSSLNMNQQS